MSVAPMVSSTTCPATITFRALVEARGAGEIAYRWVRSDGASTQEVRVPVHAPSVLLTTTWTLGVSYSGWEEIQVVWPQVVRSRSRTFHLTCNAGPGANPGNSVSGSSNRSGAGGANRLGNLGNNNGGSSNHSNTRGAMPRTPGAPATSMASIVIARPRVPMGLVTCPITLHESASVVMHGAPRTVTVRWVHGGGAAVAPQRLYFNGRDPVSTTDQWEIGRPHTAVRGWFLLQAWTPQAVQSVAAPFAFRCR
ncbi:MAG: hypothetical protein KGL92_08270 [Gammaproteobacteria bacterium]|nr:hypothetical protein [Gammaproteobacteria bacterium]